MFASSSFLLSWCLVFILAGAVLYVFDRSIGRRIYRWWYDMTHEHPLDAEHDCGFLYHRKANTRFSVAVILTLVQGAIAIAHHESTLPNEVLSMIVEVPSLMVGFYLGPWLDRFWGRRDKVFATVDQFEQGERVLSSEIHDLSVRAVSTVVESLHVGSSAEPEPKQAPVVKEAAPEPEPEVDPRALMNKYLTPQ